MFLMGSTCTDVLSKEPTSYQSTSNITLLSHCKQQHFNTKITNTNWLTFQHINTEVWCEKVYH